MVHCVSSSEPDSGETQLPSDEWRGNNQTAVTNLGSSKEPLPAQPGTPVGTQQVQQQQPQQQQASQPQQLQQQQQPPQSQQTKPSFVESSTVSSGIQVGSLEQAAADGTRQLTLTDTQQHHELADTTHLENTNESTDITAITNLSPPNHIIHSDTIIITESITEEFTTCETDKISNKDIVRELLPGEQQQQQQQLSYHTMQPMLIDNVSEDESVSNTCDEQLQASATATLQQHDGQKVYNVELSSGLYSHLYSFKSEESEQQQQQQQQLPVVEFQSSEKLQMQQQAYFGPLVINEPNLNDFGEDGAELEEESATSTEEEDEELWNLVREFLLKK